MAKKIKKELQSGSRILFEVEDLGEFEAVCQVCGGKHFDSGDNRTVLFCVGCKAVYADRRVQPMYNRPENTLLIDLQYEDGALVSFPVICNCGHGGYVRAVDGSSVCCGSCMGIVAKPSMTYAYANKSGVYWVV